MIFYFLIYIRFRLKYIKYKKNLITTKVYYGKNDKQLIVFNLPKKVTKNNIIFFVNGSAWSINNINFYKYIGAFLGLFGYVSVIVGHRLVPNYTYPTQIEDVILAMKETIKLAEEHQLQKKFIFIGFSSGAQITTLLAYSNFLEKHGLSKELISGIVSISGPINFFVCKNKKIVTALQSYLNTISNKEAADPYAHLVSSNLIPVLCIHGTNDPFVEVDNSKTFIKKINELDPNKGKLILIENGLHNKVLNVFLYPNYNKELIEWIELIDKE